jgi:hypothetical protein
MAGRVVPEPKRFWSERNVCVYKTTVRSSLSPKSRRTSQLSQLFLLLYCVRCVHRGVAPGGQSVRRGGVLDFVLPKHYGVYFNVVWYQEQKSGASRDELITYTRVREGYWSLDGPGLNEASSTNHI